MTGYGYTSTDSNVVSGDRYCGGTTGTGTFLCEKVAFYEGIRHF